MNSHTGRPDCPLAGDYLWIDSVGSLTYGVWTDRLDTVPGTEIRESAADGGDELAEGAEVPVPDRPRLAVQYQWEALSRRTRRGVSDQVAGGEAEAFVQAPRGVTLPYVWAEADDGDKVGVRKPSNGFAHQGLCEASSAVVRSHGQPGHLAFTAISCQKEATGNRACLIANCQGAAALDVLKQDPIEVRHGTEQRFDLSHEQQPRVNTGRHSVHHAHDRQPRIIRGVP